MATVASVTLPSGVSVVLISINCLKMAMASARSAAETGVMVGVLSEGRRDGDGNQKANAMEERESKFGMRRFYDRARVWLLVKCAVCEINGFTSGRFSIHE